MGGLRHLLLIGAILLVVQGVAYTGDDIEEIRTRNDVFGFDPVILLDFPFTAGTGFGESRHYSTYGYWGGKRFFLICNPRLQDLEHVEAHVIKEGKNPFARKASHTDLYAALETELRAFGEILRIESASSLAAAVNSMQGAEGDFLVLAVDVPEIRTTEKEMDVTLAFKLYGLRFTGNGHDAREKGKLERCEFLYSDSARVRRKTGKSPVDAFTSCVVEAIHSKLAHSLVARIPANEESPWNPQKDLFTIPVPGPSIGFYLCYDAWKLANRQTASCTPSEYEGLKYEGKVVEEEAQ
jgi:hypothetical protein